MTPSRAALARLLAASGTPLDDAQVDRLWAYHGRLRAANPELNLTRIHQFDGMVVKHYVDSLLVLRHADLPSPLIDMGSGAGLPGIPLAIARPDVHLILAEPRGARAQFLRETVTALGLDGVEVYDRKITPRFDRRVDGVITRAVAEVGETLDAVTNCLGDGGRLLLMKGPDCQDEIDRAARTHADRFRLQKDVPYALPGTTHRRRLLIYRRTASASNIIPMRPPRDILSEANPTFRSLRELLKGAGIRRQGRAILGGPKPIAELLRVDPGRAEAWVTDGSTAPPPGIGEELPWHRLSGPLFKELDVSGTGRPLLLVKVPEFPAFDPDAPWPEGCTLFVPFQDPENVGAALRTAAALGAARAVLTREAAHPFHPKALRAAGLAVFHVPIAIGPALAEVRGGDVPLISLSTEGEPLGSTPWPDRFGLVAGVEGPGLPESLRAGIARRIPIAPGVESLNAAAAVAIALYDWGQRRRLG